MDEIVRESGSTAWVVGVGSPNAQIGVLSLPRRTNHPSGQSGASSLSTLEVAPPDLGKVLEGLTSQSNIGLSYVIDRETHSVVIKVIDRDTKEVLREIPPEEMTKLRAAMRDLFGSLFQIDA